jgi:hypothetical protein
MKRTVLLWLFALTSILPMAAQTRYQQGTVTRMSTTGCMLGHRRMAMLAGAAPLPADEACPEYTLVGEKVVYLVVGKTADQLIPLAADIHFRLQKNELLVRIDDERRETKFFVKEMVLRSDWDRMQAIRQEAATQPARERLPDAPPS